MEKYMIYILIGVFALIPLHYLKELIFDFTHSRPLNGNEIEELGKYRRKSKINKHYNFLSKTKKTSRKFRKNMNPDGKYYRMEIPLSELPSVAASLLQNKKYEWRILAFEKDGIVDCIYCNKGEAHSVTIKEDLSNILNLCDECEYKTIFDIHNHPSGILKPSDADINACNALSNVFDKLNMNFIGIIVSANTWRCYYKKFNDNFYPLNEEINEVYHKNNLNKETNLELHRELRSLKQKYKYQ